MPIHSVAYIPQISARSVHKSILEYQAPYFQEQLNPQQPDISIQKPSVKPHMLSPQPPGNKLYENRKLSSLKTRTTLSPDPENRTMKEEGEQGGEIGRE